MKTKLNRKDRGFTIIEVMIVLAIAGLILAIIFLAVPALQRNARNNSRKNDATHFAGLVSEYAGNHAGSLPTGIGATGGTLLDITNEHWAIMTAPVTANIFCAAGCGGVAKTTTFPAGAGITSTMDVVEGFTCDPSTNTLSAGNSHSFSLTFNVENGGATPTAQCLPGS